MGYRRRNMYYLTGVPGWVRFGYSPGWVGRSTTGLPPTAEWLISSGLIPPYQTQYNVPMSKEEEIKMLEEQAKIIETQLDTARRRLEELKKNPASYSQSYYPVPQYPFTPYTQYQAPSIEEELKSLEEYREYLAEEIEGIEARIEELKKLREERSSQK